MKSRVAKALKKVDLNNYPHHELENLTHQELFAKHKPSSSAVEEYLLQYHLSQIASLDMNQIQDAQLKQDLEKFFRTVYFREKPKVDFVRKNIDYAWAH